MGTVAYMAPEQVEGKTVDAGDCFTRGVSGHAGRRHDAERQLSRPSRGRSVSTSTAFNREPHAGCVLQHPADRTTVSGTESSGPRQRLAGGSFVAESTAMAFFEQMGQSAPRESFCRLFLTSRTATDSKSRTEDVRWSSDHASCQGLLALRPRFSTGGRLHHGFLRAATRDVCAVVNSVYASRSVLWMVEEQAENSVARLATAESTLLS
jgi:hypothetical protein